jgi:pimeloyl-ACP methyl ester carboxylesterase
MTMGWVTNLDVMWELPELATFLDSLSRLGRLVVFDKRGTGLSDRVSSAVTLEERAEDIEAVMNAVGSEEAVLIGWGDGAAIAAMFASTRPERVSALVLSALSLVPEADSVVADPQLLKAAWQAVEDGWGEGNFLPVVAPLHASDTRIQTWWRRWERMSATPNVAARLLEWGAEIDLRPVLPAIQAPTLFLERSDAGLIDVAAVCATASLVPGATFVTVPGTDFLPFFGDIDPFLGEIEEFLTGSRSIVDPDRALATVLFTDIVGSTRRPSGRVIGSGGTRSTATTRKFVDRWAISGVWRWTRRATGSWRPSTGRPGPSAVPAPSVMIDRGFGGAHRSARRRAGRGERGPRHRHRQGVGDRLWHHVRRPWRARLEGRCRPMAGLLGAKRVRATRWHG